MIAVSTLRDFWERHPDAEQPLKAWYEEATNASWTQPADIKAYYRSASVLKNRRVVFNIKGNDYRLIMAIAYKLQIVYVKFVGTHKHAPITAPNPVEAIKFRMDQSGLSVKDLEPIIGKSNRVYEVLNRKRPLTLAMIRRLHKSLGIPADVLIAETAAG